MEDHSQKSLDDLVRDLSRLKRRRARSTLLVSVLSGLVVAGLSLIPTLVAIGSIFWPAKAWISAPLGFFAAWWLFMSSIGFLTEQYAVELVPRDPETATSFPPISKLLVQYPEEVVEEMKAQTREIKRSNNLMEQYLGDLNEGEEWRNGPLDTTS